MSELLYLECASGISGDMFVAALLDLGADQKVLEEALESLALEGARVQIGRVKKSGLDACDFQVLLDESHENHDHDMAYLHGHVHEHHLEKSPGHEHEHYLEEHKSPVHEHENHLGEYEGHAHEHPQAALHPHSHARGWKDIMDILKKGRLTPGALAMAERIFRILAEAEAKAHGVPQEEVHFHEVGAVDSILDIVAAAVCLDNLGISRVVIPRIQEGQGTVRCQHGLLPVPVPAVTNIAAAWGLPLHIMEEEGEFVTPTGAAIAAAIRTDGELPRQFTIRRCGMGAGKRQYRIPSLLRAFLIQTEEEEKNGQKIRERNKAREEKEELRELGTDRICKLETNIDDCSGENLGFVMERLMEAGARDVHYMPTFMKKNRPAYQLNVICSPEDAPAMEAIIFHETSTIGIRRIEMERTILERREERIALKWGSARVKICQLPGEVRCYPEYEDVAALCRQYKIPYGEMYHEIEEAWKIQNLEQVGR